MDHDKIPYRHVTDPQLSGIKPLEFSPSRNPYIQLEQDKNKATTARVIPETMNKAYSGEDKDFPPLDSSNFRNGQRRKKNGI